MKKILLLSFVTIILMATSCGEKKAPATKDYTITGKVINDSGKYRIAYLQEISADGRELLKVDSANIENGQFIFKGIASDTVVVRFVGVGNDTYPSEIILEPGNINILVDSTSITNEGGTVFNDSLKNYNMAIESLWKKSEKQEEGLQNLIKEGKVTSDVAATYIQQSKDITDEAQLLTYNFIKLLITNAAGEYFFSNKSYLLSPTQIKELFSQTSESFKALERPRNIVARADAREVTSEGKKFVDVKGLSLDGKEVALSDFAGKGNVVLVDFWASWCGPCVRSMPDLVSLYKEYKGKGFEIVGISLDSDKAAWQGATKRLGVVWPQLSNLKGWSEDAALAYGVNSIPHTLLLDKDGNILLRGVDANLLKYKIEELLQK